MEKIQLDTWREGQGQEQEQEQGQGQGEHNKKKYLLKVIVFLLYKFFFSRDGMN